MADLEAAGRAPKYISNAGNRVNILFAGAGWSCLGDVTADSFLRWRGRHKKSPRNGTRKPEDPKSKRKPQAAAETLNQYLETAQAWLNWCAQTGRVAGIPVGGKVICTLLASVTKAEAEKARKRRALTDEQVAALLTVAPADRKLAYRVALSLGLRRQELEDLLWGDLQLLSTRPYVQLRAEATKARRGDRLPIPLTLAADLRAEKPADAKDADRVFPRVPSLALWKIDLKAARIPYRDDMGRAVDFHAGTRKTLCTRMHRGNVPLAMAMRVMRHTDARLTLVDYADDGQLTGDPLPEPAVVASPVATAGE